MNKGSAQNQHRDRTQTSRLNKKEERPQATIRFNKKRKKIEFGIP